MLYSSDYVYLLDAREDNIAEILKQHGIDYNEVLWADDVKFAYLPTVFVYKTNGIKGYIEVGFTFSQRKLAEGIAKLVYRAKKLKVKALVVDCPLGKPVKDEAEIKNSWKHKKLTEWELLILPIKTAARKTRIKTFLVIKGDDLVPELRACHNLGIWVKQELNKRYKNYLNELEKLVKDYKVDLTAKWGSGDIKLQSYIRREFARPLFFKFFAQDYEQIAKEALALFKLGFDIRVSSDNEYIFDKNYDLKEVEEFFKKFKPTNVHAKPREDSKIDFLIFEIDDKSKFKELKKLLKWLSSIGIRFIFKWTTNEKARKYGLGKSPYVIIPIVKLPVEVKKDLAKFILEKANIEPNTFDEALFGNHWFRLPSAYHDSGHPPQIIRYIDPREWVKVSAINFANLSFSFKLSFEKEIESKELKRSKRKIRKFKWSEISALLLSKARQIRRGNRNNFLKLCYFIVEDFDEKKAELVFNQYKDKQDFDLKRECYIAKQVAEKSEAYGILPKQVLESLKQDIDISFAFESENIALLKLEPKITLREALDRLDEFEEVEEFLKSLHYPRILRKKAMDIIKAHGGNKLGVQRLVYVLEALEWLPFVYDVDFVIALLLADFLANVWERKGWKIKFKTIEEDDVRNASIIRHEREITQLEVIRKLIEEHNKNLNLEPLPFNLKEAIGNDPNILVFSNFDAPEGKELIHIGFDIETDEEQKPIVLIAVNYEAKRIIISRLRQKDEDPELKVYRWNDWTIVELKTLVLLEGLILWANLEGFLALILDSALRQGEDILIQVVKDLLPFIPIPINANLLIKILNRNAEIAFIGHNVYEFDIPLLQQQFHKAKKIWKLESRRVVLDTFEFISNYKLEFTIEYNKDFRGFDINFSLGNVNLGFRLKFWRRKFGLNYKSATFLYPIQKHTDSITHTFDTLLLAKNMLYEKLSLYALSKGLEFEKMDYEEQKIFTPEEFVIKKDPSNALKYALRDVFSTLSVYKHLVNDLQKRIESIEKIEGIRISRRTSIIDRIISTASISKMVILSWLNKETGLDYRTLLKNIEFERQFVLNFEKVYYGGRVEVLKKGYLRASEEQKIFYVDFASQYPHCAWLCRADKTYKLASMGKLHDYLRFDITEGKEILREVSSHIYDCVINQKPLDPKIITKAVGVVSFENRIPINLFKRIGTEGNRETITEIRLKPYSTVNTTMIELCVFIVQEAIKQEKSIDEILEKIKIKYIEYLDPQVEIDDYEENFFTSLYLLRKKIKKALKEKKLDELGFTKDEAKALEQMIKIVLNATYGISVEKEDEYEGKLYLPIVGANITAFGRALNKIAELTLNQLNGELIYTDTDGLFIKLNPEKLDRLFNIFSKTDRLDLEAVIKEMITIRKKLYAYITEDNKLVCKIHGAGIWASLKKPYYKALFQGLFEDYRKIIELGEIGIINLFEGMYSLKKQKAEAKKAIQRKRKYHSILQLYEWMRESLSEGRYLENLEDLLKDLEYRQLLNKLAKTVGLKRSIKSANDLLNLAENIKAYASDLKDLFMKAFNIDIDMLKSAMELYNDAEQQIYYLSQDLEERLNENIDLINAIELAPPFYQKKIGASVDDKSSMSFKKLCSKEFMVKYNSNNNPVIVEVEGFKFYIYRNGKEYLITNCREIWSFNFGLARTLSSEGYRLKIFVTLPYLREEIFKKLKNFEEYFIEDGNVDQALMLRLAQSKSVLELVKEAVDQFAKKGVLPPQLTNAFYDQVVYAKYWKDKIIEDTSADIRKLGREKSREDTTFIDLKPIEVEIREDKLYPLINKEVVECDGFTLTLSTQLPDISYSTLLISRQPWLYSQAIVNIARKASMIYAITHGSKDLKEKIEYKKPSELPCRVSGIKTSSGSQVVVFIPLLLIPRPEEFMKLEFFRIIEEDLNNYALFKCKNCEHTFIASIQTNKRRKCPKCKSESFEIVKVRYDQRSNYVKIKDVNLAQEIIEFKYGKKALRWQEDLALIDFLGYKWYLLIKSIDSDWYNALLSIPVSVGEERIFRAYLWVNFSNVKGLNLEPVKIDLFELTKDRDVIKHILYRILRYNIEDFALKIFRNETSVTEDDLKINPQYLFEIVGLIVCWQALRSAIWKGNVNLTRLDVSTNVNIPEDVAELLISYIYQNADRLYSELYPSTDFEKLKEAGKVKVGQNDSMAYIVNYHQKVSFVSYSKHKQILKDLRVRGKEITKKIFNRMTEAIDKLKGRIRFELQIYNKKVINNPNELKAYLNILNELVKRLTSNNVISYLKRLKTVFDQILNNSDGYGLFIKLLEPPPSSA